MLRRKNEMQVNKPAGLSTMERSRLNQARTLAIRRQDYSEVEEIDAKLAAMAPTADRPGRDGSGIDKLALVNERNRKANLEAVRKAEVQEAERKRRERKLANSGGTVTPQDPSARLKIMPRLFNAATPTSRFVAPSAFPIVSVVVHACLYSSFLTLPPRPGTPSTITPLLQAQDMGSRPVTPLASLGLSGQPNGPNTFESAVIESIEVDLGDF